MKQKAPKNRVDTPPRAALDPLSIAAVLPGLLKGYWRYVIVVFFVALFASIMEGIGFALVIPLLQTMLYPASQVVAGGAAQKFLGSLTSFIPVDWRLGGLLGILIVIFFIKSVGLVTASALTRWFANTLKISWTASAFAGALKAPYAEFASKPHGEVVENILGDTDHGSRAILLLIEFAARLVQMTVLITVLVLTNLPATLFVVVLGALAFGLSWQATKRFSLKAGRTRQEIRQQSNDIVSESITALRTVKLLNIAVERTRALKTLLRDFRRVDTEFDTVSALPSFLTDLVAVVVGTAVILFMTSYLQLRMEEALPTTALFGLIFVRLAGSSAFLFSRRLHVVTALPSLQTVHDLLQVAPEHVPGSALFPGFSGDILLEDIALRPPGRPAIFDGLSMRIAPKGLTAIIGPSGSGKTTLVDLIVRLREPDRGRVLIGGRDIHEFDVRSLRRHVGYLSQDPQLFNGTVAENLLLGRQDATEAQMLEAARHAHVHEFVSGMEKGYATPLGRGGLTLSGGQRQRLALARELLRNPGLYIFDEPTSALDQETEAIIGELINELSHTHPVVIISHRHDVIYGASVIYRIEQGKAVEMSLPELAKASGTAP